ncbi:MAG: TetR/AcrR family transcriptional regulator C-terminal domain-containing protein [Myxococcales bacterium]|nr:TetR/AcrR family transcriptional regulator C-terminal domain-containing protein [Myxococcales bacterium]
MSTDKRKRRRTTPLSRDQILRSAVEVADADGVRGLSMRKIARKLGVEAMSLYNHVKNKDDILDGMVEIVVADIAVPEVGGDWQESMRRRALSAHETLMAHPWAAMMLMSRVNVGPVVLAYVDRTIGCLIEAGFSYALADYAWNTLDAHIYGFTLQRLNFPFEPDEFADTAESFMPQMPPAELPYLLGMAQEVIAGRHDGVQELGFGLDLIIAGLERLRVAHLAAAADGPTDPC